MVPFSRCCSWMVVEEASLVLKHGVIQISKASISKKVGQLQSMCVHVCIFHQVSCGFTSIFSIRSAVGSHPYFPSGQLCIHIHIFCHQLCVRVHIFHQVNCASIFSISHLWVHIHILHQVSCGFTSIFSVRSAVGSCPYFSWYSLDTATASVKVIVIFRRHKWSRQRKRDRQTVNYIEKEREREDTWKLAANSASLKRWKHHVPWSDCSCLTSEKAFSSATVNHWAKSMGKGKWNYLLYLSAS